MRVFNAKDVPDCNICPAMWFAAFVPCFFSSITLINTAKLIKRSSSSFLFNDFLFNLYLSSKIKNR